jgi:hypothetical protein
MLTQSDAGGPVTGRPVAESSMAESSVAVAATPSANGRSDLMPSAELINRLQRHNNPFDDFVHPIGVNKRLRATHVGGIHSRVAETLRSAIDQYRLKWDDASRGRDIEALWSGVIVIEGRRGDGKTHLLQHGLSGAEAVVVAPVEFETHRPFREYLLLQLVEHLRAAPSHRSPLVALSHWFTRKLLTHAIRGMLELEWACLCESRDSDRGWLCSIPLRSLSTKATRKWLDERERLLAGLQDSPLETIGELCEELEESPNFLYRLALRHVRIREPSRTAPQRLRAAIYEELLELSFKSDRTTIFELLVSSANSVSVGSEGNETVAVGRSTLVDERLSCLVELFAMFGRPVVFAFDRLESLLGDPPSKELCQAFHGGIAQVIDVMPGIPFFLFAEWGHWQQASEHFSGYAQQRFERGIPVLGQGAVHRMKLSPIDFTGLHSIVARRMARHLDGVEAVYGDGADARILPFVRQDLLNAVHVAQEAGGGGAPTLRVVLQKLRKRYEQIIFGRQLETDAAPRAGDDRSPVASAPVASSSVASARAAEVAKDELLAVWDRELRAAVRRIEAGELSDHRNLLYQGLRILLECQRDEGRALGGWTLADCGNVAFGDHIAYGECVRCHWKKNGQEHQHGVAFLLGAGMGMPADLKTKLTMMRSPRRAVERLTILRPRSEITASAEESLPPATFQVWSEFRKTREANRVQLKEIEHALVAKCLALAQFRRTTAEDANVSREKFAHFVIEVMSSLEEFVTPFE